MNSKILHILDSIASINTPDTLPPESKDIESSATQANSIRGKFLDPTKTLNEAIPDNVLKRVEYKDKDIPPSEIK